MVETHGISLATVIKQNLYLFLVFLFLIFLESNRVMDVKHSNKFLITIIHQYKGCQN